jgi:hypothetical protein
MTPMKEKSGAAVPSPERYQVEVALGRILLSPVFRGSRRCQDFLQYVVKRALDGDQESLKERALAVEIFERKAAADLSEDSIVRVGAREVRKRLAQYYMSDGAHDAVRIGLPAGSYIPNFHFVDEAQADLRVLPGTEAPAPAPSQSGWIWWATIALTVLLIVGVLMTWQRMRRTSVEFESFWRPVLEGSNPVLLVLAHPIVYHPSTRAFQLHEQRHGKPELPAQIPVDLEPADLNGSDFVPVFDQYTGFGDTVAVSELTALFARRDRDVRLRLATRLDFTELRDTPAILIGAFTNRWSLEVTKSFRYRFDLIDGNTPSIIDNTTGARRWTLTKTDNGHSNEDYILLCRMPKSKTGNFVILAAGLTQYGTEEAGRILADSRMLVPLLKQLPAGWENRNVELVLHSQIVGGTPTPPELTASFVW